MCYKTRQKYWGRAALFAMKFNYKFTVACMRFAAYNYSNCELTWKQHKVKHTQPDWSSSLCAHLHRFLCCVILCTLYSTNHSLQALITRSSCTNSLSFSHKLIHTKGRAFRSFLHGFCTQQKRKRNQKMDEPVLWEKFTIFILLQSHYLVALCSDLRF